MISKPAYSQMKTTFKWGTLPTIPDGVGFAGSFAGIANDALIVTGGANFPDGGAPWTGSEKVWHDEIFVLDNPESQWKVVGKLPQPMGYGVSISSEEGLILIGGNNRDGHYAHVWMLQYDGDSIAIKDLPDLPKPLANSTGVVLDNTVYILGGTVELNSKEAEDNFWSLDLDDPNADWEVLSPWPGPSRMLAVAGTQGDGIYLFSGAHLENGTREYLKDAYRYSKRTGWKRIASLPHAVVAAPSPAFTDHDGHVLVFGGDDGTLISIDPEKQKHPGFTKTVLSYDAMIDDWSKMGLHPGHAPVTTPLVHWRGKVIIPGGEIMPAVRTSVVTMIEPVY